MDHPTAPPRAAVSRLAPVPAAAPGAALERFFATVLTHRATPLNLHHALAHAPQAGTPFVAFAYALRYETVLDRALQELAIVRVAVLRDSTYEWHAHEDLARQAGITSAQLDALRMPEVTAELFEPRQRVVVTYTDRVVRGEKVDDGLFASVRSFLDDREIAELTLTIGLYLATACFLNALNVEVEQNA